MNQSMQHLFSQIPRADIQRSVFDRSHTLKTCFDSGLLIPIYVDEALPGDTFSMDLSLFGRLSTMAVPVMDNLYLETFFFAVPNRLVWNNWQKFCGEQENPGDSTDYLVPHITYDNSPFSTVGSIYDYFGVPPTATGGKMTVSALFFRAYNLIWNEWFRDENLQGSLPVPKDDGPDAPGTYNLVRRGKRHDYFTSCLPWPQKGPGVEIPIGASAPVFGNGNSLMLRTSLPARTTVGLNSLYNVQADSFKNTGDSTVLGTRLSNSQTSSNGVGLALSTDGDSGLYADLSSATMTTINQLREAFQIQRLYEADARGGKIVCLHVKKIAEKIWKAA